MDQCWWGGEEQRGIRDAIFRPTDRRWAPSKSDDGLDAVSELRLASSALGSVLVGREGEGKLEMQYSRPTEPALGPK